MQAMAFQAIPAIGAAQQGGAATYMGPGMVAMMPVPSQQMERQQQQQQQQPPMEQMQFQPCPQLQQQEAMCCMPTMMQGQPAMPQQQQPQQLMQPMMQQLPQMQQVQQMGSMVFVPVPFIMSMPPTPQAGVSQMFVQQPASQPTSPSSAAASSAASPPRSPCNAAASHACGTKGAACFGSAGSTDSDLSARSPVSSSSMRSRLSSEDSSGCDAAPGHPLNSRAAIFEQLLDHWNRKDMAGMHRLRHRYWAADCEAHWVDTGFSLHGLDDIIAMDTKVMQSVEDWSATLWEVVDNGRGEVELRVHVAGKQTVPLVPLFPVGLFCQWLVTIRTSFNHCGKVRRMSFHLSPVPDVGLEPANLRGIAEASLSLSLTPSGSRLLQLGIQAATSEIQDTIISRLRGHIWEVAASPHGNHVLQKYVATAPGTSALFIVAELKGRAVAAAQHNTRSRVLERLLEHCSPQQTAPLVEELLGSIPSLCRDPFGNFVVQRLFEHSAPEQRHRAVVELAPHACKLARHRQANNVVRAAIAHCAREDKVFLANTLMADRRGFASLAKHIAGSFVARELRLAGLVV